jgi:hypothetical protein
MRLPVRPFARVFVTLLLTLGVLCPLHAAVMVERVAQPHPIECDSSVQGQEGARHRPSASVGGDGVAFPCFLHSLTSLARPIDSASQHVSSGFADDEDWLRLIPTSVTHMALNFFDTLRGSTIAIAASALVSACGGGGGNADETTQASTTSTSTSPAGGNFSGDASSTGTATAPVQGTSTVDTATADSASGAGAVDVTRASVGPVGTIPAPTADDTVTVASASTGTTGTKSVIGTRALSAAKSGLGINLSPLDYYSPSVPTIDLMKKAAPWLTQCNPYTVGSTCKNLTGGASAFDTREESNIDLDADGWVRSLPASDDPNLKFRSVATILLSGGWQQAGQYIVRYDGSGTLSYSGVGTRNAAKSTAGRDVIDVINTNGSGLTLSITATTPGNYIRNIRVYPPGGACAGDLTTYAASADACTGTTGAYVAFENFPSTSIWHPALLSELKGFRTARFMDWQRTNTSTVSDWSQRTIATARSWNTPSGVPVEQIASLANAANIDPWVNVPTHASDDYVVQFARVLHQQLSPNLSVNVEYSNEPWNYSFSGTNWMYSQAQAAWPAEVAAKTNAYTLQANWYANRLVQVCNLIKNEFGADRGRVRCVANTQAASTGSAAAVLNCTVAAKTLGQPCGKSIDVLAIAPYFGGYISATKLRTTVSAWYTQPDGGLTQLFNEIMGSEATTTTVAPLAAAGSNVAGGSLAQIRSWMVANKAIADQFNIPLWAYEGGQGLAPPGGDNDATLVTLFTNANRDPRMAAAYTKMLADWQAAGGQTFSLYDDVAAPSKYGFWGLKENMFDTNAVKWNAVTKVRDTVSCWWSGC